MTDAFVPNDPESKFKAWMDKITDRVLSLETATSLKNSSILGGALTLKEAVTGALIGVFGKGQWVGKSGIIENTIIALRNKTDSAYIFLYDSEFGMITPKGVYNWQNDDQTNVTSATFTPVYRCHVIMTAVSLWIQVYINTPAGTAGEARVTFNGVPSGVRALPDGTPTALYEWKWHISGLAILNQLGTIAIEVRRTSGAGNITVFNPEQLIVMADETNFGSTGTGI